MCGHDASVSSLPSAAAGAACAVQSQAAAEPLVAETSKAPSVQHSESSSAHDDTHDGSVGASASASSDEVDFLGLPEHLWPRNNAHPFDDNTARDSTKCAAAQPVVHGVGNSGAQLPRIVHTVEACWAS
jgi:hypothetical protein